MVMDQNFRGYSGATSGIKVNSQAVPVFPDPNLINNLRVSSNFLNGTHTDVIPVSTHLNFEAQVRPSEANPHEDLDFSDAVLKYINHILMEEDVEEKACMFQESAALQAAEKSFYEVIGEQYPTSKDYNKHVPNLDQTFENPSENSFGVLNGCFGSGDIETLCPDWNSDPNCNRLDIHHDTVNVVSHTISQSSHSSSSSGEGVEEASKFLPNGSNLIVDLSYDEPLAKAEKGSFANLVVKGEKKVDNEEFIDVSRGKKNPYHEHGFARGKDNQNHSTECSIAGTDGGKAGADDRRTASEFLKQIRQHATPTGDGMQRLAHYFAQGLEARLAGSGTQIYTSINLPTSAADILKAYHIYLATCPFRKISNFFANRTIMNVAKNDASLHIVDFGILYGFQWPCFLQRLSSRPGGPPKLRVTGIDLPCPGFRPSQRVEETGRRLARYAETFNVPFEFHAIAQKWETIKLEDLKINKDEVLAVNCLYRFRNLLDETVIVNSPRNIVLNLIRKMNPAVFVLGIVNGAYNAPFFITRFREALFHYSSFFDMLDANIPRGIHERMLLEKTVFGREAMNVIACEAAERIERPETYKQWQVRNMRAGFEQLPLEEEMIKLARNRVKSSYHKDFVIDEDGHWLLQGWKGRIVYGLSSWRPAY
ncbi:hypothetical protein DH2020_022190 [Rehmannia glutinosa]|uniref:Scarecrow-like protein 14 n=1 Tax=Rehmannia glutinosa TaxID=99300 RepID=A0ABR0WE08_REHGL